MAQIFIGILVIFAIIQCSGGTSKDTVKSTTQEKKHTETVTNSGWDSSVYQVERFLKDNLKDPDSYEGMEWSKVTKVNGNYVVRHKYRAKNSFGGYVIDNKIFVLDTNGKVLSAVDYKQ